MSMKGTTVGATPASRRHPLGRGVAALGMLLGRSLFPLATLVILGGTFLWGPWTTLVLAVVWFTAASFLA